MFLYGLGIITIESNQTGNLCVFHLSGKKGGHSFLTLTRNPEAGKSEICHVRVCFFSMPENPDKRFVVQGLYG